MLKNDRYLIYHYCMKKFLVFFIFFYSFLFLFSKQSLAITFDLIAPSGELQRGQEVKFTINVDTEGKPYSSTQIGMTYDNTVLEYISTSAGDTFTTVSTNPIENGKLIITGSSTNPYSGSGIYAYVTFKIIAQSPGSTEICALFNPQNTPTPIPPTNIPITSLPTSGIKSGTIQAVIGSTLVLLAALSFFIFKNI